MMENVLKAAGEASLSAGVMILAVLTLRAWFQDRTPRKAFCLLWDLVLVRLLVLGALPSPVSVRRWMPGPAVETTAFREVQALDAVVTDIRMVPSGQWTSQAYLLEGSASCTQAPASLDWWTILCALWLGVALLLAGGFLWSHLRSRRVYNASLPCRDGFILDWIADHPLRRPVQARISDRIAAPLTYGVLYPVILLPARMDWEDRETLSCVLSHEHTHIRRFDALRKVFLAAVLCIHWFNPLVWVMYALSNRDIELACDEAVLRNGADRERYALALLGLEERRGRWSPSGSHFSGHALEERIKAIMKRKHISFTALVAVLVVMCVTTTVFASAAPEDREDQHQNAPVTGYVYGHNKNGNEIKDVAIRVDDSAIQTVQEVSTFYPCDKNNMYGQPNTVIPAHETLCIPIQITTQNDDSYLVASVYCDGTVTLNITDLNQFSQSTPIKGEPLREWMLLENAGVYYALLSNETDHDITVEQIHLVNSEFELPDGRTIADVEKSGIIHWINSI